MAHRPQLVTVESPGQLPPLDAAIAGDVADRPAERVLRLWRHHAERGVIPDEGVARSPKAHAFVSAGRWLVQCPFAPCTSAQVTSHSDPRFFCIECENRPVGGKWLRVVWPDQVAAIESLLLKRPAQFAYWSPGETLDDLERENAMHGIIDGAPKELKDALARTAEAQAVVLPWEA